MFNTPVIVPTTVWARLPDHLRVKTPRDPWTATRFANKPDSFLEGPSFDRDGNLYVVDIPHGRIFRISPDREFSVVAEYHGEPNGLKIHRDGTIFVADHKKGIVTVDAHSGAITPILTELLGGPMKGTNDLCFAGNGDLYFTDQGDTSLADPTGRLVCLRVDGRVDILLDNVPSPNGLVINKEETVLFLAVTRGNCIWRVPLPKPGQTARRVGIFVQLSGGNGPDGMAMDEDDNLFIAHTLLGTVWGFSHVGEPLYRIRSCEGNYPTNCAFGGPDRRSLFITESRSGTILRAELPVPGRALFSHA